MQAHILVVEDDAEIREGVAIYLKNQGYTVQPMAKRGWRCWNSRTSALPLWT